MSSPHLDPDTHGSKFGKVTVTVDLDLGDCIIIAPGKGLIGQEVPCRQRYNSLDEIRGAYRTQNWLSRKPQQHPHAGDMARALKFAGRKLKDHQTRQR
ncbi:hypothetical protein ACFMBG_07120 [Leisingera sp. D0M16]|uniref:hypothetical protein n=1 Tax=Leisingera coralii TaxID=3351347 RepID=UPI003B7BA954